MIDDRRPLQARNNSWDFLSYRHHLTTLREFSLLHVVSASLGSAVLHWLTSL